MNTILRATAVIAACAGLAAFSACASRSTRVPKTSPAPAAQAAPNASQQAMAATAISSTDPVTSVSTQPITPSVTASSAAVSSTAAAPSPCFNTQYHFTCALPPDYIITDEEDGPGTVMTLSQRVLLASEVPPSATVRVAPIGKRTLEKYVQSRVVGPVSGAEGVLSTQTSTATYGAYQGIQVLVDRQYANGEFKSETFAFVQGTNVILVTVSSPVAIFDRSQTFIPAFVSSLAFSS